MPPRYEMSLLASRQVQETVRRVKQLPLNFRQVPRGLQGISYQPRIELWFTATSAKNPGDDSFTADVLLSLWGPHNEGDEVTIYDPDANATTGWDVDINYTGYATQGKDGKLYAHVVKCEATP